LNTTSIDDKGLMMNIIIGSDHVGYPLKTVVADYLRSRDIAVMDIGPDNPDEPVDYPDYALRVKRAVASGEMDQGVLICGTGLGMSMAANKYPGIRAALCHDAYTARQARAHNDANVLCMGSYIVSIQRVEMILDTWLDTPFDEGRHVPRLAMLDRHLDERRLVPVDNFQFGIALSPTETIFGPLLFSGRLAEGLNLVVEAGFDCVELSLRNPQNSDSDEIKSLIEKSGIGLSAVATGQSCLHDSLCLSDSDAKVVASTVARLKSLISFASHFSAPVIIGGIRGKLSGSKEDQKLQWGQAAEAVSECARHASKLNTGLLIEPINRYETNFINNAQEGMKFIDEVGEGNVKLLLDTFHMNIEEADIHATLQAVGPNLGYVHFADSNRKPPGQGHIDFTGILKTLVTIDYQGPITAEILPLPDDRTALKQTAGFFESLRE
jgi:RpiB/LacA/LacB family sugar-phosphate isomerase